MVVHSSSSSPSFSGMGSSGSSSGMSGTSGRNAAVDSRVYGITHPISRDSPTPYDGKLTCQLEACLKQYDLFESDEEMNVRMEVLRKINDLVKQWIRTVSVEKNLPPDVADTVGGKVFAFGSYRLGVHTRGADLDTLCVGPRHIERLDFFTSFYQMLKERSEVTELHAVEEAFVPLIKMKFAGIEMDMLFARLALKEVPDNQTLDDDLLLKNLDEKSVRSLNGCRVTDEILRLVPNRETFCLTLRAVKLWAKRHGIYSNVLGYLGGVSWAMLVARTCQLYPNAAAATLVQKFFLIFSRWEWPSPVLLKNIEPVSDMPMLQELVWDPRTKVSDRYHLMPIITPAFPQQNSTFNVSNSTRTVMEMKFKDGLEITKEVMEGKASWDKLFEQPNFFHLYRHYIVLICSAENQADHLTWSRLIESRIRTLVTSFERNPGINLVHVNPETFRSEMLRQTDESADLQECMWFMGLDLHKGDAQIRNINLTHEIQAFTESVIRHANYQNIFKETMHIEARYCKKKDLPQYLQESVLKFGSKKKQQLTASSSCSSLASSATAASTNSDSTIPATTGGQPNGNNNQQAEVVSSSLLMPTNTCSTDEVENAEPVEASSSSESKNMPSSSTKPGGGHDGCSDRSESAEITELEVIPVESSVDPCLAPEAATASSQPSDVKPEPECEPMDTTSSSVPLDTGSEVKVEQVEEVDLIGSTDQPSEPIPNVEEMSSIDNSDSVCDCQSDVTVESSSSSKMEPIQLSEPDEISSTVAPSGGISGDISTVRNSTAVAEDSKAVDGNPISSSASGSPIGPHSGGGQKRSHSPDMESPRTPKRLSLSLDDVQISECSDLAGVSTSDSKVSSTTTNLNSDDDSSQELQVVGATLPPTAVKTEAPCKLETDEVSSAVSSSCVSVKPDIKEDILYQHDDSKSSVPIIDIESAATVSSSTVEDDTAEIVEVSPSFDEDPPSITLTPDVDMDDKKPCDEDAVEPATSPDVEVLAIRRLSKELPDVKESHAGKYMNSRQSGNQQGSKKGAIKFNLKQEA